MLTSVAAPTQAIETWAEHWNDHPKPLMWHKPVDEIISEVRRGRESFARVKTATDD